jgi:hypothetical protein
MMQGSGKRPHRRDKKRGGFKMKKRGSFIWFVAIHAAVIFVIKKIVDRKKVRD